MTVGTLNLLSVQRFNTVYVYSVYTYQSLSLWGLSTNPCKKNRPSFSGVPSEFWWPVAMCLAPKWAKYQNGPTRQVHSIPATRKPSWLCAISSSGRQEVDKETPKTPDLWWPRVRMQFLGVFSGIRKCMEMYENVWTCSFAGYSIWTPAISYYISISTCCVEPPGCSLSCLISQWDTQRFCDTSLVIGCAAAVGHDSSEEIIRTTTIQNNGQRLSRFSLCCRVECPKDIQQTWVSRTAAKKNNGWPFRTKRGRNTKLFGNTTGSECSCCSPPLRNQAGDRVSQRSWKSWEVYKAKEKHGNSRWATQIIRSVSQAIKRQAGQTHWNYRGNWLLQDSPMEYSLYVSIVIINLYLYLYVYVIMIIYAYNCLHIFYIVIHIQNGAEMLWFQTGHWASIQT